MTDAVYHVPVMLEECLDGLNIKPNGVYADLTYGGGGHSKAILERLGETGKLLAFDQDDDALNNLPDDSRLVFCNHNFQYFKNFLKYLNLDAVDGVLADLGVSSHQIDDGSRGFSFRTDDALDMRMNQNADRSAEDFVNQASEREIGICLKQYGELKNARKLAAAIVSGRKRKPIKTTGELVDLLKPFFPENRWIRPMAQVFQAIRIEINEELEALKTVLSDLPERIKPGGRLVVMSYHSLEDRIVKRFIQSGNVDGELVKDFYGNTVKPFEAITRKPVEAQSEEVERNPRARSAKLRIAERIKEDGNG
jgi:16S rRNA (cytosine1402-N4)-methyltransferase